MRTGYHMYLHMYDRKKKKKKKKKKKNCKQFLDNIFKGVVCMKLKGSKFSYMNSFI